MLKPLFAQFVKAYLMEILNLALLQTNIDFSMGVKVWRIDKRSFALREKHYNVGLDFEKHSCGVATASKAKLVSS